MALTPEQAMYDFNKDGKLDATESAVMTMMGQNDTGNSAKVGSSTDTTVMRLTYQSAKSLLEAAVKDAGWAGKLTPEDIHAFVDQFAKKQDEQIAKVVTTSSDKTTAGATQDAADKVVSGSKTTKYPSFFDPAAFAKDYVWSKIDFKNTATLGGKALSTLEEVRGLVESFQLMGVSENDIRNAAKQIAMGNKTTDSYKVELQQIAKKEYPQFADRFDKDPTLTTYDIASPILGMLAKTWEMDVKDVKFDNPIVMSYMNYAGADGKGQQPSRYDLLLKAKNDPKYQLTEEANNNARDSATSFARAFGFGV